MRSIKHVCLLSCHTTMLSIHGDEIGESQDDLHGHLLASSGLISQHAVSVIGQTTGTMIKSEPFHTATCSLVLACSQHPEP